MDGAENAEENSVLNHIVELENSSQYTLNNEIAVPTGEIVSVEGTPFDFREERKIADMIDKNLTS